MLIKKRRSGVVAFRSDADNFATVIQVATSSDAGKTWSTPRRPYRDAAPGQHGFLSTFRVGPDLGLVWLDAKNQPVSGSSSPTEHSMGAIGLRNVTADKTGRVKADSWINPIVCECCPTSAVMTMGVPTMAPTWTPAARMWWWRGGQLRAISRRSKSPFLKMRDPISERRFAWIARTAKVR